MPNRFELQVQQMRQQNELFKEKRFEDGNLYAYQFKESDVPLTEEGRGDARSISIQIDRWKDTLSADQQNEMFMFVSLKDSLEAFTDYLLGKYKGSKKQEWSAKLSNAAYRRDVERLFYSKIYDHKYQLRTQGIEEAFASPGAQNRISEVQFVRFLSKCSHEAVGRYSKVAKNNPELVSHSEDAKTMIADIVREVLQENGLASFTMLIQPSPIALEQELMP